jgi:uncharacterized protein YbjT (DUF2867 family)
MTEKPARNRLFALPHDLCNRRSNVTRVCRLETRPAVAEHRISRQDPTYPVYELAGPRVYSYEELMRTIARTAGLQPVLMRMPFAFWGALAGLAEILPHPPLTRNQVELMQIVGSCNARPSGSARPIFR